MKKLIFGIVAFMVSMVGIAWLNYAVLLHFHEQAYYYTLPGMLLSGAVATAESFVLIPASYAWLTIWFYPTYIKWISDRKEP